MTINSITQGQSDKTEFKERGFESAFAVNLSVFASKFAGKYPYWHFDLNCGSGINEDAGCIGSPLAFLRAAESFPSVRYVAGFCDKDKTALGSLMQRESIVDNNNCFLFHGENESLIEAIPNIIDNQDRPSMAVGTVLSDPNGFETPINALGNLSKVCPRLDFIIHWNSRIRRLYRGHGWGFIDIDSAIAIMNKKCWLIRKPMGAHQWTVLIGRNVRIGDHKTLGFYHLDSMMGRNILRACKAEIDCTQESEMQMQLGF